MTPLEVDDDKLALREAAAKPTVAQQFYAKYDGSSLPPKNIAQNVSASFGVPTERTSDVYDLLIDNAWFVGFIKKIKDKEYLDTGAPVLKSDASAPNEVSDAASEEVPIDLHDEASPDRWISADLPGRSAPPLRSIRPD